VILTVALGLMVIGLRKQMQTRRRIREARALETAPGGAKQQ
jgi:hypothetical protein